MTTKYELMVAPNGARLSKSDHPMLPLTPGELAETAKACRRVGATALHLHVRDAAGRHSLDAGRYREAVAAITDTTDIGLQISTEAAGQFGVAAQIDCIAKAHSPAASVALREIERAPGALQDVIDVAAETGTALQFIMYSAGDLRRFLGHVDAGRIPASCDQVLLVLGQYGQRPAVPADLDPFLAVLGDRALRWSVCAFGPQEQSCLLAALRRGGQARIGFENNLVAPDGTRHRSNADAVRSFVAAAARAGFQPRPVAA